MGRDHISSRRGVIPGGSSGGVRGPSGWTYGTVLSALVPIRVALSNRSGWSAMRSYASMPLNDMPTM